MTEQTTTTTTPRTHLCARCLGEVVVGKDGVREHHQQTGHWPKRYHLRKRKAVSKTVRRAVFERDNYQCTTCGFHETDWHAAEAGDRRAGNFLTIDHVIPWALGGTNDPSNLTTLCFDCNHAKSYEDRARIRAVQAYLREHGIDVGLPTFPDRTPGGNA